MKEERRASYKAANIPEPVLQEDEEDDPLGVNTLAGTRVKSKATKAAAVEDDENSDAEMEVEVEEDDEEVSGAPLLFDSELPTLQAALEKADVLLEVVDARDPLGFRSPWLEELFVGEDEEGKKGKVVIVLTKIGSFASHSRLLSLDFEPGLTLFIYFSHRSRSSRGSPAVASLPSTSFHHHPLQVSSSRYPQPRTHSQDDQERAQIPPSSQCRQEGRGGGQEDEVEPRRDLWTRGASRGFGAMGRREEGCWRRGGVCGRCRWIAERE